MASSDAHRSHSETEYRELLCEYQSLQRKFDSKVEALLAVSQELSTCQVERDQYKARAIDYVDRSRALKSALLAQKKERNRKETVADEQHQNLLDLLNRINEENRALQREIERMKAEVGESRGDNKLLRQQLARYKLQSTSSQSKDDAEMLACVSPPLMVVSPVSRSVSKDDSMATAAIMDELERLKTEHAQLERDLKSMLCEKEELVIERDAFKNKAERLNKELNYILNGDDRRVVADVDQLVAENRFLKEQLQHAREENGLRKAELSKYKSCLEKRKPILKSAFSMGGKSVDNMDNLNMVASTSGTGGGQNGRASATGGTATAAALLADGMYPLITPKQVRQLLQMPEHGADPPVDYRGLASALNDALNDRNLALSHQRKANKILGNRVTELEARIHTLELAGGNGRSPIKRAMTPDTLLRPPSPMPIGERRSSHDVYTMTDEHDTFMSASVDRLRMGVDLTQIPLTPNGHALDQGRMNGSFHGTPSRRRIHSLESSFIVLNNGNGVDDGCGCGSGGDVNGL